MLKKIIFIIAVIAVLFSIFDYRTARVMTHNTQDVQFTIASGDSPLEIGKNLEKNDLIASRYYFYYYAWKERLRGKMNYGDYIIKPQTTLTEMTRLFVQGDAQKEERAEIVVTFPEGLTITEMSSILTASGLPGNDFLSLAKNPTQEIRTLYDFVPQTESLEGYLFPDTYNFFAEATAEDIVKKMLANFDRRVTPDMRTAVEAQGLSLRDVVILASIVEGESRENDERPVIAGIFLNRLEIGMALQSDATIDYITGNPEMKHTLEDVEIDSPYNTYKYAGLPPGPVNAPSLTSMRAVIYPRETEYFYFLNNIETGETAFAKTFEEHVANKAKHGL